MIEELPAGDDSACHRGSSPERSEQSQQRDDRRWMLEALHPAPVRIDL
jgi:hypothetical protein